MSNSLRIDIARNQLQEVLIQLQHGIILVLQATRDRLDPSPLVTSTVFARTDTLAALSQLSQCLAAAAPIPSSLSTNLTRRPRRRASRYTASASSTTGPPVLSSTWSGPRSQAGRQKDRHCISYMCPYVNWCDCEIQDVLRLGVHDLAVMMM